MVNFRNEFGAAVDVANVEKVCFGPPVESLDDVRKWFVGRDSYLCKFVFQSLVNPKYKEFTLGFKARLWSKNAPGNAPPARWDLFFLMPETGETQFLDNKFAKIAFDFDVEKFMDTDFFRQSSAEFEESIGAGLEATKKFRQENLELPEDYWDREDDDEDDDRPIPNPADARECKILERSIEEALPMVHRAFFADLAVKVDRTGSINKRYTHGTFDPVKYEQFIRGDHKKIGQKTMKRLEKLRDNPPEDWDKLDETEVLDESLAPNSSYFIQINKPGEYIEDAARRQPDPLFAFDDVIRGIILNGRRNQDWRILSKFKSSEIPDYVEAPARDVVDARGKEYERKDPNALIVGVETDSNPSYMMVIWHSQSFRRLDLPRRLNENSKVTLTVGQIARLVLETKRLLGKRRH